MLDTQLFYVFNSLVGQSPLLDSVIVFCATYLAYLLVVAFAVFICVMRYPLRDKLQMFAVAVVSVGLARGVITEVIRFFYHRPRPFAELTTPPVQALLTDPAWSFPSGHATFFFALSTAVYLYDRRWGTWFLTATVFITLGRVVAGVHYPSDILAGALIGIGTAYLVYRIVRSFASKPELPTT